MQPAVVGALMCGQITLYKDVEPEQRPLRLTLAKNDLLFEDTKRLLLVDRAMDSAWLSNGRSDNTDRQGNQQSIELPLVARPILSLERWHSGGKNVCTISNVYV